MPVIESPVTLPDADVKVGRVVGSWFSFTRFLSGRRFESGVNGLVFEAYSV